jgi:hypothetical protein
MNIYINSLIAYAIYTCGGNLYNILLRQELNKEKSVKPENQQTKINEITTEYFLIKYMRKFGRMLQIQHVQRNRLPDELIQI